jgi:hypothetical protein
MKPKLFTLLILLANAANTIAQGTYQPLNTDAYHLLDRIDIEYGKVLPQFSTNFKPYNKIHIAEYISDLPKQNINKKGKRFDYNQQYLMNETSEWLPDTIIKSKKKVWIFYPEPASMFMVNKDNFLLKINPVIHLQLGKEANESQLQFLNTRGLELRGHIAKRVGYYTYLTTTLSRFPSYVQGRINNEQAIPGEGYWKEYRVTGQDYFTARGYITFNAFKHIDFQFGHDKNFIGNGHRSMILSDYANNNLFLKIQTKVWRITYTNLFKELTVQYNRGSDRLLDKKYAAFHHLNIHVAKWLDIGIYEAAVFRRNNHFELQYLNPIIFYRAIEQALGSPDNMLLGIDFKANMLRHISLYGQFVLDEFNSKNIVARNGWWANKFAGQLGLKYINAFAVQHLDLQGEFNVARPYMYAHTSTNSNFTHYNQPMAHPLGANFYEAIGIIRYQIFKPLTITGRLIYAIKGADTTATNFGGNVFTPSVNQNSGLNVYQEFGNTITQGVKQNIFILNTVISYQIKHNLYADLNVLLRNVSSSYEPFKNTDLLLNFGVRWNMPYRTYEF